MKIHILLFLLLSAVFELAAESFRIKLYSRVQDKAESGLSVLVFETKKIYVTDNEGVIAGDVPKAGSYRLRLLRPTGTQEIEVTLANTPDTVTIYTDKKQVPKGAIQVSGEKDKTVVSRYKVKYEEIKRMPGSFGEALRGLETLPGITPNIGFGGGANGIIIRGADPDWNTYLYDDLPILYPYHFDGLTSVIHNDLIKSIDIYTGAYPSNYANATGGVIEIETVDNVEKDNGTFQISLWNTTAMIQKKAFGGKGYVAIGGKIGYLDRTFGNLAPDGIRLPRYTDSQIKVVYNFNTEHQISFYNMMAEDSFAAAASTRPVNDPAQDVFGNLAGASIAAGQRFRTTAFRYTWTPTNEFTNRITVINYDPLGDFNAKLGTIDGKQYERNAYIGVRQDAVWNVSKYLDLDVGSEFREISFRSYGRDIVQVDPRNLQPNPFDTRNPAFTTIPIDLNTKSKYANAYLTAHLKYGNFAFTPGVRYDYLGLTNQGVLGPRATVSYNFPEIGKGLTVYGGAGDYFRYANNLGSSDIYNSETGNPDIRFEKAFKQSGGVEQKFTEVYSLKVETFKNEFSSLITPDGFISEPISVNPDRRQLLTNPIVYNRGKGYSNRGDGWSHGYELLVKKSNRPGQRDWFGWISYTWSQSFRNDNILQRYDYDNQLRSADEERLLYSIYSNSKEQNTGFDRTHIANIVYGWRYEEGTQIGLRWAYLSSAPVTPVIGDDGGRFRNEFNNQPYFNPTYSNNPFSAEYGRTKRLEDYHRLDIRLDKFYNFEWGYVNWYIEIVNIYMRKNPAGESFNNNRPYSINNPNTSEAFGTLVLPGGQVIPFFNIGMEVKF